MYDVIFNVRLFQSFFLDKLSRTDVKESKVLPGPDGPYGVADLRFH